MLKKRRKWTANNFNSTVEERKFMAGEFDIVGGWHLKIRLWIAWFPLPWYCSARVVCICLHAFLGSLQTTGFI